jgi:hypothetical protein
LLPVEAVLARWADWSGRAAIALRADGARLPVQAVLTSWSNRAGLSVKAVLARRTDRPRLTIEAVLARWANRSFLAIEALLTSRTHWSSGPTITLGSNRPRLAIQTVFASRSNRPRLAVETVLPWCTILAGRTERSRLTVETVLSRGPRQAILSGRSDRPWLAVEAVTARRASRATLALWAGGTALTLRATGPRDSGSFARAAEAKRFAEAGDQTRGSLVKATEVHPLGVRVVPDPKDAGCLLKPGVTNCTLAREARRVVDDTEQTLDRRKLAA